MNKDLWEKYNKLTDEELIQIIESKDEKEHESLETKTIEKILIERGYQISEEEEEEEEEEEVGLNFKPLILGVLLVGVNFLFSSYMYQYSVTGSAPEFFVEMMRDFGASYDIIRRVLVIGLIGYYRNKQKGSYIILWMIAGLLFGGWILIVVGIIELMTDYPIPEVEESV